MQFNLDIDHRSTAWLGIVFGVGAWILSWLINILNLPTVNITLSTIDINVRDAAITNFQGVASGINTGFFARILGGITGVIPSGWDGLFFSVLGGFLVVYVGKIVIHTLDIGERFADTQGLVSILLAGSIVWGIILGSFAVPNQGFFETLFSFRWMGSVIMIAIYSAILVIWIKLIERIGLIGAINPQ